MIRLFSLSICSIALIAFDTVALPDLVESPGPRHALYLESMEKAVMSNKHVLLHFTAEHCPNPIVIQQFILEDSIIQAILEEHYIYVALNVSDKRPLSEEESYTTYSNLSIETHGARNADLEMTVFHENIQPYLVICDGHEALISDAKYIATKEELRLFLHDGIKRN